MTRVQIYNDQARRRIDAAVKRIESTPIHERMRGARLPVAGRHIRVVNQTGADLELGHVAEYKGATFSADTALNDFRDYVTLNAIVPTGTAPERIGIVPNFIADGELGQLAISGIWLAQININDESHGYATPGTVSDYLESSPSGPALILDRESGLGVKWAYVLLDRPTAALEDVANFRQQGSFFAAGGVEEPVPLQVSGMPPRGAITLATPTDIQCGKAGYYAFSYAVRIPQHNFTAFFSGGNETAILAVPMEAWMNPAAPAVWSNDLAKNTTAPLGAFDGAISGRVDGGVVDTLTSPLTLTGHGIDLLNANHIVQLKINIPAGVDVTAEVHVEYLG